MCMPQHLVPRFGVWAGAVGLRCVVPVRVARSGTIISRKRTPLCNRGGDAAANRGNLVAAGPGLSGLVLGCDARGIAVVRPGPLGLVPIAG